MMIGVGGEKWVNFVIIYICHDRNRFYYLERNRDLMFKDIINLDTEYENTYEK